jgi:hypothetical protein
MNTNPSSVSSTTVPPPEYEAAMADIEQRATRGELTLAQARHEIFELRNRFAADAGDVMQWAAQAN